METNVPSNSICPVGMYCYQDGSGQHEVACPGGYYNPYASTGSTSFAAACYTCNAGYYCPMGSIQQYVCPAGHYCTSNLALPIQCGAGYYNPLPGAGSIGSCITCPAGFYCLAGSRYPSPCP